MIPLMILVSLAAGFIVFAIYLFYKKEVIDIVDKEQNEELTEEDKWLKYVEKQMKQEYEEKLFHTIYPKDAITNESQWFEYIGKEIKILNRK